MRIMCRARRDGGTKIEMYGHTYHFKEEDDGRHIANMRDDHADELIEKAPEGYERAEIDDVVQDPEPEPETLAAEAGAAEPQPDPEPDTTVEEPALEDLSEADLAAKYEEVFGQKPHHAAKPASIIAKIEETLAAEQGE